jgi:hypothetical protein
MRPVSIAALVLLASMTGTSAQDTLKPGDVISGQLRLVKTHHPNGMPISAYQIVVDHPKKFANPDEFCNKGEVPKTFHVAVIDDDKTKWARLKQLVGKKIAVIADEFFCSHTAWHIGDAVLIKWRFVDLDAC